MDILQSNVPATLDLPAHTQDKVLLLADRWTRADGAHSVWATIGKRCVDFVEGKQWTDEEIRQLEDEERPALTFNKMGRLIRLILGYHRNNRTDLKVQPGYDGSGSQDVANVLTRSAKNISEINQLPYVDTEVFMDGIITGRGFYDCRLDFARNDFGEIKWTAKDPFSIRLDPDGDTYDLNESCSFVMEQRTVSIEEVEFFYGGSAAALLWPLIGRHGAYTGGVPEAVIERSEEITPWRGFGGQQGGPLGPYYFAAEAYIANAFDRARKTVRLVDCQHQIRQLMWHFVDLETGDREPIPEGWTQEQVKKVLWWTEQHYAKFGKLSPLRVQKRPGKKIRWTTVAGDIVVYDQWSAYETYTLTGFFPWFRRGKTRGAAEDLIDPQREINKRRSSQIDIVTRTAHSGWMYHQSSMTEEQEQTIEQHGARPGVNIKWKGEQWQKPEKIQPGVPPQAMERLEQKSAQDLNEISGINESALGELDRVQSGRAIEARQRQAVIAIQVYMDNMTRTKHLGGRKTIEMIQNHYTEQRLIRVQGDDGKISFEKINERMATGQIINDVTVGRYVVSLDETPLTASYLQAQTEEIKSMVEAGLVPIEAVQDVAINASTMPQKDIVLRRVQAMQAAAGIPSGDALLTPQGQAQVAMAASRDAAQQPAAPMTSAPSIVEGNRRVAR